MNKTDFQLEQGERQMAIAGRIAPSSCEVDSVVVPRILWERTVKVVERVQNSRRGQMGKLPLYCPEPMNRHGIDNLMNEIRRHNVVSARLVPVPETQPAG